MKRLSLVYEYVRMMMMFVNKKRVLVDVEQLAKLNTLLNHLSLALGMLLCRYV